MKTTSIRHSVLAGAMLLAGCVTGPVGQSNPEARGDFVRVDAADAQLVFVDTALKDAETTRVAFEDVYERHEYALFRAPDGGQAEVLYIATRDIANTQVALEFGKLIADTVPAWNFNRGQSIDWRKSEWTGSRWGGTWIQPYTLTGDNRGCVGFSSTWDDKVDDPRHRPSKVLFGYYCAAPGQALEFADAIKVVHALGIRGVSERLPVMSTDASGTTTEAPAPEIAALARGQADRRAGRADFPNLMAEVYQVGGGGDDRAN